MVKQRQMELGGGGETREAEGVTYGGREQIHGGNKEDAERSGRRNGKEGILSVAMWMKWLLRGKRKRVKIDEISGNMRRKVVGKLGERLHK